jgi:hypothetical protein
LCIKCDRTSSGLPDRHYLTALFNLLTFVFLLALQATALIVFVNDIVAIEHGPGLVTGNLHAIVLVIPRPAEIPDPAPAHIVRHYAFDADSLASPFECLRE